MCVGEAGVVTEFDLILRNKVKSQCSTFETNSSGNNTTE